MDLTKKINMEMFAFNYIVFRKCNRADIRNFLLL